MDLRAIFSKFESVFELWRFELLEFLKIFEIFRQLLRESCKSKHTQSRYWQKAFDEGYSKMYHVTYVTSLCSNFGVRKLKISKKMANFDILMSFD